MPKIRFIHADGSHRKTRHVEDGLAWREVVRQCGVAHQSCSRVGSHALLNACEDIVTCDTDVVVVGSTMRVAVHNGPTGAWFNLHCQPHEAMSDVYRRLRLVMDATVEHVVPMYSRKHRALVTIGPHTSDAFVGDFLVPLVIRIEMRPVTYHTAECVRRYWPYGVLSVEPSSADGDVIVRSLAGCVRPHRVRLGVSASLTPVPIRSAFAKRPRRSLLRKVLDT